MGANLTYTITISANQAATGVLLSDMIPPGSTFVSSLSSASCRDQCGVVVCTVGGIAAGGNSVVTIVVRPGVGGVNYNVAGVAGNEFDPNPANNTSTHTVTVGAVPLAIALVAMSPSAVTAGSSSTGTVTLNDVAPTGVTVTLSSSATYVTVPGSVPVAAGSRTATFQATTSAVTVSSAATISATYGGVTKQTTLVVNPASPPAGSPTVSVSCPTKGALWPAGYNVPISATASDPQGISRVDFFVNSATTPFASDTTPPYEATHPLPASLADGEVVVLRAKAFDSGGASAESQGSLTILSGNVVTTDTVVGAGENYLDNQNLIVASGTLTIDGLHRYTNLVVLPGARVTHTRSTTSTVSVFAAEVSGKTYIACNGAIDVTGKGYLGGNEVGNYPIPEGRTYGNALGSQSASSGSYGGKGGQNFGKISAEPYGSLFDPRELGGGGGEWGGQGGTGGGAVYLKAGTLVLDGSIIADGSAPIRVAGAGGAILLDVGTFSGSGLVRSAGGLPPTSPVSTGAGGRIAIRYADMSGFSRSRVSAQAPFAPNSALGGAGTILFKSSAQTYGELVVDNLGTNGFTTPLPSIGTGTVTAVSGSTFTDSTKTFPFGVANLWVEVRRGTTIRGTYKVVGSSGGTLTVTPSPTAARVGDTYRGILRLDALTVRGGARLTTADAIEATTIADSNAATQRGVIQAPSIKGTSINLSGASLALTGPTDYSQITLSAGAVLSCNSPVTAGSISLTTGSLLTHDVSTITSISQLSLTVSGTVSIDATSKIDVTGKGYLGGYEVGNPSPEGRTYGNALGSQTASSGSYGGRGGQNFGRVSAATYGSLFDPRELGGGGGEYGGQGGSGGGAVYLKAGSLVLNGSIIADGSAPIRVAGAGGAILVEVGTLSGTGLIRSAGGLPPALPVSTGAGGRIAIRYTDMSGFPRSRVAAASPFFSNSALGAAGTILFKSSTQTYGELLVDNLGTDGFTTPLPAIGAGTVTAVSGSTFTDSAKTFPFGVANLWVEVKRGAGVIGTYKVLSSSAGVLTLNQSVAGIVQVGDTYQGILRLDIVNVRGRAKVSTTDRLECPSITVDTAGGSSLTAANYP